MHTSMSRIPNYARTRKPGGFATATFGMRDFHPNGSHTTTQWFSILLIPILPLRSFRVSERPQPMKTTLKFYDEIDLNFQQVFSVYGFMLLYLIWLAVAPALAGDRMMQLPTVLFMGVMATIAIAPAFLPGMLRRRARRVARVHSFARSRQYRFGV